MTIQPRQPRTPSLMLATAAAFFAGSAVSAPVLAQVAGSTDAATPGGSLSSAAQIAMTRAEQLLKIGQFVRAQQVLDDLTVDAGQSLSDNERLKVYGLIATVGNRIKTADPLEISLQRAELALEHSDLRTADAHASSVARSAKAMPDQLKRAREMVSRADAQRAELAPRIPKLLDRAMEDYRHGRFAEAKQGLTTVRRSGVLLSLSQAQDLDSFSGKIAELERVRGGAFDVTANASVVPPSTSGAPAAAGTAVAKTSIAQPGVVKPVNPSPEPAPASAPAPTPAEEPVASAEETEQPPAQPYEEKLEEMVPIRSEQPAVQPTAQPPAEPPPPPTEPVVDQIDSARRFAAQQLQGEADAAMRDARYSDAMTRYNRLLNEYREYFSREDLARMQLRLDEARGRLAGGLGQVGDPLSELVRQNDIIKQQALAEFENQMNQALRALDAGDTRRARDLASSGRVTISNARNVFNEAEYETYLKRVDEMLGKADAAERAAAERAAAERADENQRRMRDQAEENKRKTQRRVEEAFKRARELQSQLDYDAALQVVNEQILFIDPHNPLGLIMRDILSDAIIYRQYHQIQAEKQRNLANIQIENQLATIPPRGIIDYPKDWPAISARRSDQLAFSDTEDNRRVKSMLAERTETVDFQEVTLASALNFIKGVTKVDLDVDWHSLEAIGVKKDATVSLSLTNKKIDSILNRLLNNVSPDVANRAGWTVEDGTLVIASEDVLRQKTVTVFYDIKDLLAEAPNYTNVPKFDLTSVIANSNNNVNRSVGPFAQGDENVGDNSDAFKSQARRTEQDRVDEIVDTIKRTVDATGWADLGGSTGSMTTINGNLIIKNTPQNHQAISGLLQRLREVRAMQVNVETRFLLVSQDFFERIGFDLDIYLNTNNNQVRTARAGDRTIQGRDFFNFGSATPGLQRQVTGAAQPTGPGAGNVGQLTQGVVNPRAWSPIGIGQDSSGLAGEAIASQVDDSSIAGIALSRAPALGIAGSFLDDIQVDFLVQATQADRRSVRLNAPRLTFTNGQTSNIFVATQTAFISDLQPVVSESAVGFDPQLQTISEGVRLLVEGTVTADRRYVTLNVDTSVSKIDGIAQFPISAIAGGQLVNSQAVNSFIQVPTVTVTSVSTTVTVPDQGTIMLGGQRLVNEYEVESGVPVLSKIPILNRFFNNTAKAKDEQTLLILIKPTILIQNEQEDQNFPGLLDTLGTPLGG